MTEDRVTLELRSTTTGGAAGGGRIDLTLVEVALDPPAAGEVVDPSA